MHEIKQEIYIELLDVLIKKLEEEIDFDKNYFSYGDFFFDWTGRSAEKKVVIKLSYNEIKPGKAIGNGSNFEIIEIEKLKKPYFWLNKKEKSLRKKHIKLKNLMLKRKNFYDKQEHEKYLSHLPKDRKKQLMREIKLKHILKDV